MKLADNEQIVIGVFNTQQTAEAFFTALHHHEMIMEAVNVMLSERTRQQEFDIAAVDPLTMPAVVAMENEGGSGGVATAATMTIRQLIATGTTIPTACYDLVVAGPIVTAIHDGHQPAFAIDFVDWLTELGISKMNAEICQQNLDNGATLISVATHGENAAAIDQLMSDNGADQILSGRE